MRKREMLWLGAACELKCDRMPLTHNKKRNGSLPPEKSPEERAARSCLNHRGRPPLALVELFGNRRRMDSLSFPIDLLQWIQTRRLEDMEKKRPGSVQTFGAKAFVSHPLFHQKDSPKILTSPPLAAPHHTLHYAFEANWGQHINARYTKKFNLRVKFFINAFYHSFSSFVVFPSFKFSL